MAPHRRKRPRGSAEPEIRGRTITHIFTLTLTHARSHTHICTHPSHSHAHTRSLPLTLMLSRTLMFTRTFSLSCTHTHAQPHHTHSFASALLECFASSSRKETAHRETLQLVQSRTRGRGERAQRELPLHSRKECPCFSLGLPAPAVTW